MSSSFSLRNPTVFYSQKKVMNAFPLLIWRLTFYLFCDGIPFWLQRNMMLIQI